MCLGSTNFGSKCSEAESFALLDQYYEAGGRFIDTANNYSHWAPGCGGGEAETVIGRWLAERGCRDEIFLATKVGFDASFVERGLRAEQIQEQCEQSLERLGVETIDLYYAHCDDRDTPLEESLAAFDRLVQAGSVRYIAASNYLAWRLNEAEWISQVHNWAAFCCVQQRFTYLLPKTGASFDPQLSANDDLLDYCDSRSLPLLAYSPLLGGLYNDPNRALPTQYDSPGSRARLTELRRVAEEVEATPNQVVYSWMLQQDKPILPLLGVSNPTQLEENLGALDVELSAEQLRRLNGAGV